jgi:O-antigen/teichoic acid export membrane protein
MNHIYSLETIKAKRKADRRNFIIITVVLLALTVIFPLIFFLLSIDWVLTLIVAAVIYGLIWLAILIKFRKRLAEYKSLEKDY